MITIQNAEPQPLERDSRGEPWHSLQDTCRALQVTQDQLRASIPADYVRSIDGVVAVSLTGVCQAFLLAGTPEADLWRKEFCETLLPKIVEVLPLVRAAANLGLLSTSVGVEEQAA